jgi:hypothetical protein
MTFSNLEGTRKLWWQDTLIPDYKYYANQLTQFLAPDFDPNVYVKADTSEVPALQESNDSLWARATNAFNSGYVTRNEARRQVHLDETDDGNVYKSALNTVLLDENNIRISRDSDPSDITVQNDDDYVSPENNTDVDKPQDDVPNQASQPNATNAQPKPSTGKSAKQVKYSKSDQDNLLQLFDSLPAASKLKHHAETIRKS